MPYVLESSEEFERLEYQSTLPAYDYRKEMCDLVLSPGANVLDAGCGSGIVTRYFAQSQPKAKIIGCDTSDDRVALARQASKHLGNASYRVEDVTALTFANSTFDVVVCRFVLQHVAESKRAQAMKEFHRCLKTGGKLYLIDIDGTFYNLYPRTSFLEWALDLMEKNSPVDLRIGRKLLALLRQAGFEVPTWRIEALQFTGESLRHEINLTKARIEAAAPLLTSILGGDHKMEHFKAEFLKAMAAPETIYFYNKVIAVGQKEVGRKPKLFST